MNLTTSPLGRLVPAAALLLLSGLASRSGAQQNSRLPAIPAVRGPLALRVAWPAANSAVTAGDSLFVFGTVGDGRATLTIDGKAVTVAPNGAWLAWVAVPQDSALSLRLEARLGTQQSNQALSLTRADWVREERAWVDRRSLSPTGRVWLPSGETVVLTVRAAPGAIVRWRRVDGTVVPLSAEKTLPPVAPGIREFDRDDRNLVRSARGDRYVGVLPPARAATSSNDWVEDRRDAGPSDATLEVIVRGDTTRVPWPLAVTRLDDRATVTLDDGPDGGPWRPITGRPLAGRGTYTWFFARGTWTRADARWNNEVRLRLADGAIAWVPLDAVHLVSAANDPRPALVSSLTLTPAAERTSLRIPLTRPVPVQVGEDERRLVITLFDAISIADWTRYGAENALVRSLAWQQTAPDQVTLTIDFNRTLWGWRYRVDGSDLVFDFRPSPKIDSLRPLAGRRIVVDAGHPPGGACGPTGLCEPEANLAIAQLVRDGLARAGATVVMTRTGPESVALRGRSALADSLNADLFLSIHNNAFPDGVNPFTNSGTSTFFNHPVSLPWARLTQRRLVEGFGLRDLGVARGDLAVVRPTWFPAILTEGMFLMVPAQEAALRTPLIRQRYADAVVAGVRDFLRETARRSTTP